MHAHAVALGEHLVRVDRAGVEAPAQEGAQALEQRRVVAALGQRDDDRRGAPVGVAAPQHAPLLGLQAHERDDGAAQVVRGRGEELVLGEGLEDSGGAADPGAAIAGEVTASQTSLGFGPWRGKRWKQRRTLSVHNVSTRPLTLTLSSTSRLLTVEPATVVLKPGATAAIRVTAAATSRPALPLVTGMVTVRPAGVQALRIPWVIVFRPFAGSLLGPARVDPPVSTPSADKPSTLTVVVGRITGGRSLQVQPVGRLDVLLYTAGGTFIGVSRSCGTCCPASTASASRAAARPARRCPPGATSSASSRWPVAARHREPDAGLLPDP